jgi:hypothetical protein
MNNFSNVIFSRDGLVYKFKDLGNPNVKLTSAEPKALVEGILLWTKESF